MVDDMTPMEGAAQPLADVPSTETKQSFLSTPNGRIALIAGAVVLFLVVAAVATVLVLNFLGGESETDDALNTGPGSTVSTPTVPTGTSEAVVEPGAVPASDLFTFRDIFDPVLKPRPFQEATPSDETTGVVDSDPETLYLLNIVVEDGVAKALLEFNTTRHTLAEGETISGTPWQVLSIGSNSVVMLYGDSRITLSIGQGVTTDGSSPGSTTPTTK